MSDLDNLICKDCEYLKYSCGENIWEESIGCYKHLVLRENECDGYKKEPKETYEEELKRTGKPF